MKGEEILRLLVIETSLEDAERLLSTLRNAGFALRPSSAEDSEELEAALERKPLDMILINPVHMELSVSDVANAVTRSGKDIPVLALLEEDYSIETSLAAIKDGAIDAIASENLDHLNLVLKREISNLTHRRRLRKMESALRETEKRCHALLDSSRDAIAYVHEGMHVYANPAYLAMFDYDDFEDLEGMPILDIVTSDYAGLLKDILKKISKGEPPPDEVEIVVSLSDGKTKEAMMEFSAASVDGEPCTQVVLRDKSVDPELAKQLKDLKTQDLTTGLHNRQYMTQTLDQAISETHQQEIDQSLLFLQIDNFKEKLEQIGLAGVDLIVGDVAKLIRKNISENETAGRFGDASFAILCRKCNEANASELGKKICKAVEDHICEVGDHSLTLSCSIGVVKITEAISNSQDLLTIANATARQAEEDGGNQVAIHDPIKKADDSTEDSLHWLHVVKDALKEDRLVLAYQPIVSLHGESDPNYEVLLRLNMPDGQEVHAGQFMAVIQEHELMIKVDQWVIQKAIEVLAEHNSQGNANTRFFIKLSPQTLSKPGLLPWLAKLLQAHRLSGDSLVFEAPESKLMTNLKPARQFLKGLRQLHCLFAIEQFGSGLNSFQILKHVPADYLKIDRSFMRDLPTNTEHQQKIKEISDQAHSVGKVTIAEFVEDAASMSILWQSGVNFVQGNFLQEPEKVLAYDFN